MSHESPHITLAPALNKATGKHPTTGGHVHIMRWTT